VTCYLAISIQFGYVVLIALTILLIPKSDRMRSSIWWGVAALIVAALASSAYWGISFVAAILATGMYARELGWCPLGTKIAMLQWAGFWLTGIAVFAAFSVRAMRRGGV